MINLYFNSHSPSELNLPYNTKEQIQEQLQRAKKGYGPLQKDMFDTVLKVIIETMESDSFRRFKNGYQVPKIQIKPFER
jgi:hypothetical protein